MLVEWYDSIEAEYPTREQILNKELVFKNIDFGTDPATMEAYEGGDDEHEKAKADG